MDKDLTNDELNLVQQEIKAELDKCFKDDLAALMENESFRRVVSYLFMASGLRISQPFGNSKDIFNAGKRAIGIQLTHAIDSIDVPYRMKGLELRQKAEFEYTQYELTLFDRFKEMLINKNAAKKRFFPKDDKSKHQNRNEVR